MNDNVTGLLKDNVTLRCKKTKQDKVRKLKIIHDTRVKAYLLVTFWM